MANQNLALSFFISIKNFKFWSNLGQWRGSTTALQSVKIMLVKFGFKLLRTHTLKREQMFWKGLNVSDVVHLVGRSSRPVLKMIYQRLCSWEPATAHEPFIPSHFISDSYGPLILSLTVFRPLKKKKEINCLFLQSHMLQCKYHWRLEYVVCRISVGKIVQIQIMRQNSRFTGNTTQCSDDFN